MSNLLIIEDDPIMAQWLVDKIHRDLGIDEQAIEVLETEAEFRLNWLTEFSRGERKRPDCIVIDVMLRWTDPDPKMPPRPPDVVEGGHIRAGFRCRQAILEHAILAKVPVLLFTSLTKEDCQRLDFDPDSKSNNTVLVNKDDGQKITQFLKAALSR